MRCLVTGAKGFLGSFLTKELRARGHDVTEVSSKETDLREPNALHKYTESYDRIYHLAAWTQAGDFCLKHPGEQWINNQLINTHVLKYWLEHQKDAKLIAMGTSCSYPEGVELFEDNYLTGKPIDSLFTYGMSKRMLYTGMLALAKQYNMKFIHFIPSTLYGPNYHTDGRQMHFIFDLIRKILHAKEGGSPPVLWGNGHQKRELVFAQDFVENMLSLDHLENESINMGMGEEHSIREFADIICSLVGYNPENIIYDQSKYVGAKSKVLKTVKIEKLLPTRKQTPLTDGLTHTIEWFTNAYATV